MKTVHWQLPFCSLTGTQYRIDIYAEGTVPAPVQLTGAATPFETAEDASDNFFEPVRPQTATIHVINDNLDDLSALQPANATDRPVRVINLSTNTVEWQGFLSCETYSQEYNSRPHTLDLTCNSVLAAMRGIRFTMQPTKGMASFQEWLNLFLQGVGEPISNGTNFYFQEFMTYNQYVGEDQAQKPRYETWPMKDALCLQALHAFKQQEEVLEDGEIIVNADGVTMYDMLSKICRFLGLTAREHATTIYLTVCGQNSYAGKAYQVAKMSDLQYCGTNHTISVRNAAHKVQVSSDAEEMDSIYQLPRIPRTPALEYPNLILPQYGYAQFTLDSQRTYTGMTLAQCHALATPSGSSSWTIGSYAPDAWGNPKNRLGYVVKSGAEVLIGSRAGAIKAGACWGRIANFDLYDVEKDEKTEGLLMQFLPSKTTYTSMSGVSPILSIRTPIAMLLNGTTHYAQDTLPLPGQIKIEMSIKSMMGFDSALSTTTKYANNIENCQVEIYYSLRCGNFNFTDIDGHTIMRANSENGAFTMKHNLVEYGGGGWDDYGGIFELRIYPFIKQNTTGTMVVSELFISDIRMSLIEQRDMQRIEDTADTFLRVLDNNADETIEVSNEIATRGRARLSPYHVCDANSSFIDYFDYHMADGTTVRMRPEQELLNRLALYYSAPRSIISLEVQRPTTPLPLTRLTGYDGRTYIPLSESRDWRTGTSTIKCFESPD